MNLYENKQLMDNLKIKVNNDSLKNVRMFEREMNDYKISIFIVETDTINQLSKEWLVVSEALAYNYQSECLKKSIEIWNVYIFFLLKEKPPLDLKFTIENNKFSSRKFVMHQKNQSINEVINNKLFSLVYKKDKANSHRHKIENMREFIKIKDKDLAEALYSDENKKIYISNLTGGTNEI